MRAIFAPIVLVAALSAMPALAGEADIRSAQKTIRSQIEAFLAGDNAAAYSYAAPNIKRLFPTLERFMGMVTSGYQPVYKPRNYAFGEAREPSGGRIVQRVLVTGPDGGSYEAIYTLEIQDDGTWRITGVSLHETEALSA